MSTVFLLFSPLINILVTGIFTGMILRQYVQRRRSQQLYWSLALGMAFLATIFYVGMVLCGPTSAAGVYLFRGYYMFGATIMPSWLGLGSVALLRKRRLTRVCAGLLTVASVIAAIFVLDATIDMHRLAQVAGTPGTGILQPGPWLFMTILLNTLGVVGVAGVALYSGWQLWRHQVRVGDTSTINILRANICIFVGAMLNAAAGSMARFFGVESTFWLVMAVGWIVLFAGVVLASRRVVPVAANAATTAPADNAVLTSHGTSEKSRGQNL